MPLHIDEMSNDVTMVESDLPLTSAQIDKLVKLVLSRLADQQRDAERSRAATQLRRQSFAPLETGD